MGKLATTFDPDIGLYNELLSYSSYFLLIEIRGRGLIDFSENLQFQHCVYPVTITYTD